MNRKIDSTKLIAECEVRARLASREDRLYSHHMIEVLKRTLAGVVNRHNSLLESTGFRGSHEDLVMADGVPLDVVHRDGGETDVFPVRLDKPIDHLMDINCLDSVLKKHDEHMLKRSGL